MSLPRPILPGRIYLLTRRCVDRLLLLRPDEEVNRAFKYCLGIAAERYGIRIIHALVMGNHYHAVVYDPHGMLPRFLQYFHAISAGAFKRVRGKRENFWSTDEASYCHLVELRDVLEKVVYTLANPVIGHLVERVSHWPGASTLAWNDGREVVLERPKHLFGAESTLPESVTMQLIAPPCFDGSHEEWSKMVLAGVEAKELEMAAKRAAAGKRILGRKAVREASPWSRPKSAERRSRLRPFIAAKNLVARVPALEALARFRRAYRFARALFKLGWREVPFPAGTWAMLHLAGVSVAPS